MKKIAAFFVCLFLWQTSASAQTIKVPHLINFQSVLTDPAGSVLPDGFYNVRFRVLDPDGAELYQETQNLEALGGVVSAMVGHQGELLPSIFNPEKPRFLEVEVEGEGPPSLLEIVSVPYAMHAEEALRAAPGSLTAEMFAEGAMRELLAALAPEAIPPTLVKQSQLTELQQSFQSSDGATQIGVSQNFVTTQGPNLQAVLNDFDTEINSKATREYVDNAVAAVQANIAPAQNNGSTLRAYGTVTYSGADNASLSEASNVARLGSETLKFHAAAVDVHFSDPVPTPYNVQVTLYAPQAENWLVNPAPIINPIVHSKTANGFVVDFKGGQNDFEGFQFAVLK